MSSARPSGIGLAFMKRRLCLFGDFERHTLSDSSLTVSRYETTGSEIFSGTQAWSSSRSLRQISRCNSPAPATMCSPDSSIEHWTSQSHHVTSYFLSNTFNTTNVTDAAAAIDARINLLGTSQMYLPSSTNYEAVFSVNISPGKIMYMWNCNWGTCIVPPTRRPRVQVRLLVVVVVIQEHKILPVQEDQIWPAFSSLLPASASLLGFCTRLRHGQPGSRWTSSRACCEHSRTSWSCRSSRWTGQRRPDRRHFRTARPLWVPCIDPSSGLFCSNRSDNR